MSLDDEIGQLYQGPLADFVAHRNALAKRAGTAGPAIKQLEKPSVPAWAVNQLCWRKRAVYDRLVTAAERLRAAHLKKLAGEKTDVPAAEAAHGEALARAGAETQALLAEAGDAASPATLAAITETLQALPTSEPVGRLIKPLKLSGFEAFAGLIQGAGAKIKPADVLPFRRGEPATARPAALDRDAVKREQEEARLAREIQKRQEREEAARKKEAAKLETELAAARKAERAADAALAHARGGLDRARQDLDRAEREQREAVAERRRLEARLRELSS